MKGKVLRIVLLVAVIAGIVVVTRLRAKREDPNWVAGSGTVEATEIGVASQASGRLTTLRVAEGDVVREGEVIAELEHSQLSSEVQRNEAAAYTASMNLANLARGSRSEEVRARAAALHEALASLQGSRSQAGTARSAYGRPPELRASVDAAAAQVRATGSSVNQARAAYEEAKNGLRPEELASARAARSAASSASTGAETVVGQSEDAVRTADAAVAEADAAVTGAESDVRQASELLKQRSEATTQVAAAQTQYDTSKAALTAAKARQETVESPPRTNRREQASQQLTAARAARALAETDAKRAKTLFDAGAVSRQRLDQANTAFQQAQAAERQAQAVVSDLDAGALDSERREASAGVNQAEAAFGGANTALSNARHEQAILVTAAQQQLDRAVTALAQMRQRKVQAQANADQARERLKQAQAGAKTAGSQSEQSQAQLELAQAGTRTERLAQAQAAVQVAEAQHNGATAALSNAQQAYMDRFNYRQNLFAADQAVGVSQAKVEAAQAQLDLALAGNTSEAIEAARGQMDQANAAQKTAQAKLDDAFIRAPATGTVSELILRQGEAVTPGSVIVRMLDLDHLWVRIYVPTRAFTKVKRGQDAQVKADAFPSKAFKGRVLTVSDQAEFTPKNAQTVEERVKQVFWVKVDVGAGEGQLKPGLPVDVRMAVNPAAGPAQAGRLPQAQN